MNKDMSYGSSWFNILTKHVFMYNFFQHHNMTTIMIVDDARFMRILLKQILESNQLATNVVEAIDGASALEMYKKIKPDLVTMDINMPNSDGITCMKEILNVDPLAKIVMITSVEQKNIIDDALNSGAKGYVKKPFNKNEISYMVKKLLN